MPAAVGSEQRAASKFIVFEQFEKMNTQGVRQSLKESEVAWLENLQPIAPNNLPVVPGPSKTPLAVIPSSSVNTTEFYAVLNGVDYLFTFTASGAGYSVNIATGVINQFAGPGTFSPFPDVTTWRANRILIYDIVAGYCTYDGTVFVKSGGVSPDISVLNGGSNFSSPPPITITTSGAGELATAVAVISGGEVVAVNLTNPGFGYAPGDVITINFGTGVGSGGAGHVTMTGFNVSSISLLNAGSFFPNASGNVPLSITGGGGSGATAFATVVAEGGGPAHVVSVTVTAGGTGYTSSPNVSMSISSGTAPVFSANLGTQSVANIFLDNQGSGYVTPPSVTISGGGGSGATAHSTISAGGGITGLFLDSPGSGYTSTPSVVIGTGTGASAAARAWPLIAVGTTLAVFQGRVWLGSGNILQYTGTQGYDDFNAANGAGSLAISDADLIHSITALRSANNYLYIMGDQSVKQIGNISLNSFGNLTLFTIVTLTSDQGTIYPKSCGSFNRVFVFANSNGIYGVYGSSVQKISDDLDGIFKLIDFSLPIQAALVDINNIHNICFLARYKDPVAGPRTILLVFNGRKWFVGAQGDALISITSTASVSSGQLTLYGAADHTTVIGALFSDPTVPVKFKLQTALTHHGNAIQRKKVIRAGFAVTTSAQSAVNMSVDSDETPNPPTNIYTFLINLGFRALSWMRDSKEKPIDGAGRYLGVTLTGTLANFTVTNATMEYQEINVGNRNTP